MLDITFKPQIVRERERTNPLCASFFSYLTNNFLSQISSLFVSEILLEYGSKIKELSKKIIKLLLMSLEVVFDF